MVGGPKPKASAVPSKEDFKKATDGLSSPPAPEPPIVAPAFAPVNPSTVA